MDTTSLIDSNGQSISRRRFIKLIAYSTGLIAIGDSHIGRMESITPIERQIEDCARKALWGHSTSRPWPGWPNAARRIGIDRFIRSHIDEYGYTPTGTHQVEYWSQREFGKGDQKWIEVEFGAYPSDTEIDDYLGRSTWAKFQESDLAEYDDETRIKWITKFVHGNLIIHCKLPTGIQEVRVAPCGETLLVRGQPCLTLKVHFPEKTCGDQYCHTDQLT